MQTRDGDKHVRTDIERAGYEPVWKDYNRAFDSTVQ